MINGTKEGRNSEVKTPCLVRLSCKLSPHAILAQIRGCLHRRLHLSVIARQTFSQAISTYFSRPLVNFGDLKALEPRDRRTGEPYKLGSVNFLRGDLANPGHVLVGDSSAVLLMDPDRDIESIAGMYNWYQGYIYWPSSARVCVHARTLRRAYVSAIVFNPIDLLRRYHKWLIQLAKLNNSIKRILKFFHAFISQSLPEYLLYRHFPHAVQKDNTRVQPIIQIWCQRLLSLSHET